ncbi:MAG: class I adenylate-forming enzyme family protein [Actinomycetota bacterium]
MTTAETDFVDATVLWSMLADRATASPHGTMLIDEHDRRLTFAETVLEAERVAAGLLALGIEPGATVSWQLPTRIDTIVLSLALSRLAVVQNPIIPIYRIREVGAMVRQCGAEWLITVDTFRGYDHRAMAVELGQSLDGKLRTLIIDGDLPTGDPATLPQPPHRGDQVRWIYTTSGTTSAPKGVCHTDASLIAGGVGLASALDVRADDVGTILFPYAHIGGPDMLITGLVAGIPIVLMEAFDPERAVPLLRRNGATLSGGGTAFYTMFLQEQRKNPGQPMVPSLRALTGGGAPMSEYVFHQVRDEMGIPVLHGYGMTECPMITQGSADDGPERLASTVGRPVRGCEVEIRDDDGAPLAAAVQGHVWVRGPMLLSHYLVDGEVVDPRDDGWFATGDLGYLRPDKHLVLVGRSKDLIIRKGESISPMEIEEVIIQHPGVADAAVIGLADAVRGERICAVLQLHEGAVVPTAAELRSYCIDQGLAPFKAPEQVKVVEALPKTPTMKIRKQDLRVLFADAAMPQSPEMTTTRG